MLIKKNALQPLKFPHFDDRQYLSRNDCYVLCVTKKNTVQQSKVSLLMVDDCTIFLKQNQSEIQIQLDLSLCQMHLNYPKN